MERSRERIKETLESLVKQASYLELLRINWEMRQYNLAEDKIKRMFGVVKKLVELGAIKPELGDELKKDLEQMEDKVRRREKVNLADIFNYHSKLLTKVVDQISMWVRAPRIIKAGRKLGKSAKEERY